MKVKSKESSLIELNFVSILLYSFTIERLLRILPGSLRTNDHRTLWNIFVLNYKIIYIIQFEIG